MNKILRKYFYLWVLLGLAVIFFTLLGVNFIETENIKLEKVTDVQFTCDNPAVDELFNKKLEFLINMNLTQTQLIIPTSIFTDICTDIVNGTGIGLCIHMADNTHYQVQEKMGSLQIPSTQFICKSNYTKWSQIP